ncbi:MAG: prepilin-type N-terminal cleavage/methylation domain-containing protein [Mariprofundaceae bacterium]
MKKLEGYRWLAPQQGFTLIELMVSMLIAMVVLGGLLLSFQSQYTEYKYQNKRMDSVQDLEFVMRTIADDLRNSIWSNTGAANAGVAVTQTYCDGTAAPFDALQYWVWDTSTLGNIDAAVNNMRTLRKLCVVPATAVGPCFGTPGIDNCLRFDRRINGTADDTNTANADMLYNVTDFRVFQDVSPDPVVNAAFLAARTRYQQQRNSIPNPLPSLNVSQLDLGDAFQQIPQFSVSGSQMSVRESAVGNADTPAFTILVELSIPSGYKGGSFVNAQGVDARPVDNRKRIWRYIQIQPHQLVP